jgi:hypothetical protein
MKTILTLLAIALVAAGCGKSDSPTPIVAPQLSNYCVPWQNGGLGNSCTPSGSIDQACYGIGTIVTVSGQRLCKTVTHYPVNETETQFFPSGASNPASRFISGMSIPVMPGDQLSVIGSAEWGTSIGYTAWVIPTSCETTQTSDVMLATVGYSAPGIAVPTDGTRVAASFSDMIVGSGILASGVKCYKIALSRIDVTRCYDFTGRTYSCS